MKKIIFIIATIVFSLFLFVECKPKPGNSNDVLYPIEENGLYGFIDENGNVVISPQFLSVASFSDGLSAVVIDTIYKTIEDDSTFTFDEKLTPVYTPKKTNYIYLKYGYINPQGQYVITPNLVARYSLENDARHLDYVPVLYNYSFNDGLAVYMDSTSCLYGYINIKGDIAIDCKYKFAARFSEQKAIVEKQPLDKNISNNIDNTGIIDSQGNLILNYKYTGITNYCNGRAFALAKTKEMELSRDGTITFPTISLILLDEKGHEIKEWSLGWFFTPKEFTKNGIARFESRLKNAELPGWMTGWHYVDTNGDYIEPIYKVNDKFEITDPLSQEDIDKLDRLFSIKTRLTICPEIHILDCTPFHEGFAAITADSIHWFFIDKYFIIRGKSDDPFYEEAGTFNNGLAPVKKNGRWGYINDNFDVVIPYKFDQASSFDGALATVSTFNEDTSRTVFSYINRKGEIVWHKVSFKRDVVDNDYAKKSPEMYGQWLVNPPKKKGFSKLIYILCLLTPALLILVVSLTSYHKKKNKQLEKEKQLQEQEKIKEYNKKIERERARLVAKEKERVRLAEERERKRLAEAQQNNVKEIIASYKQDNIEDRKKNIPSKSDKIEITRLLEKENIEYFYHFTAVENVPLIKKYGGLYSWWSLKQKGINVPFIGGSGGPSQSLDVKYGLQDYVRLSFCNNHPMQYRHKQNGVQLVLFKVDKEVATWSDTLFSDINATDNNHHCGGSISDLRRVNFSAVKRTYVSREDSDFKPHQAEILVKSFIPIKYIKNIDNPIYL